MDLLKLGTYNVRNMFDSDTEDGSMAEKPERCMRALADILNEAKADIVGLQEVENIDILEDFNQRYLAGAYQEVILIEGNSDRGIDVALLSRYPIAELRSHRGLRLRDAAGKVLRSKAGDSCLICRDLLMARIDLREDLQLAVFVVHLKSKRELEPEDFDFSADDMRAGEARAVRDCIQKYQRENPSHLLTLLGDFNEQDDSPESSIAPLIHDLEFYDPLPDKIKAPEKRWTYSSRFGRHRLDYLLLGPQLEQRYLPGSIWIHRQEPSWTASDHRLMTVDIEL